MKRGRDILVWLACLGLLMGFVGGPLTAEAAKIIRLGHGQPPGSAIDNFAHRLADVVNERSKGDMVVQIFPSSQLGKELDRMQLLQLGGEELDVTGDMSMSTVCPEWGQVLTTPFVVRSKEHFRKIVDGPAMKPVYDCLQQRKGLHHLGWVDRGPRYLTANRPIRDPGEVKGLRLRVPDGVEAYVVAWRMLGATVVSMDISELFLGLRQGTIEAQENPLEMVSVHSLFEVQKYVNLTGHMFTGYEIFGSEKWFKSLTPEQQKIINDAAAEAVAFGNKEQAADETRFETQLKEKGMTFMAVDRPKFEAALKELPKQPFAARWAPGFYEAVKAVQ